MGIKGTAFSKITIHDGSTRQSTTIDGLVEENEGGRRYKGWSTWSYGGLVREIIAVSLRHAITNAASTMNHLLKDDQTFIRQADHMPILALAAYVETLEQQRMLP